ncbi:Retrotransposon gag protein [Gossypium australe]|uniref:Retrotransposon gag protein n=1 Tax=Gossypium australe TaxID=47621 RepID=A0A5B6VWC7_9ROSI|nr:Retrotransposon gag protein [Gossypium australe]
MEVSDSFKMACVIEGALRLKLFSKNVELRNEITTFQQIDDESLYDAWERFKELLHKFPHHGIPHCIQLETFYNGLNTHTRFVVDAYASGDLLLKTYNEAYEIIERIACNNYQWPTNQAASGRRVLGVHELDALTSFLAQNDATLRSLENQMSKIANELQYRPQGALSSDTDNLRKLGKENCKAVILRSGRTLEPKEVEVEDEPPKKYENQPIVEIPTIEKPDSANSEENKLPPKLRDPGSFTIPCNIGKSFHGKSLSDLKSSINLMPMFLFRRLGSGKAISTIVTLQLANRSLAYLEGKIENVLVTFNILKVIRSPDEVEVYSVVLREDLLVLAQLEYNDPLECISSDSQHQDEDDTCLEANSKEFSSKFQF